MSYLKRLALGVEEKLKEDGVDIGTNLFLPNYANISGIYEDKCNFAISGGNIENASNGDIILNLIVVLASPVLYEKDGTSSLFGLVEYVITKLNNTLVVGGVISLVNFTIIPPESGKWRSEVAFNIYTNISRMGTETPVPLIDDLSLVTEVEEL